MDEKEFDYINLIPFIDIMLVLLTIVLTTSTFVAQGAIQIKLPKASRNQVETFKTVCIEIDRAGSISVNSKPITLAGLCKEITRVSRKTPVLIRADRDITLQIFVDVMDAIKRLGFEKVSLQTEVII